MPNDCFSLDLLRQIISTPIGTFLSAPIGYFVGNRLSIDRYRMARFNDAADEFRHALHPARLYMRSNKAKTVGMDSEWMAHHELAWLEFRHFLPRRKRRTFDQDWQEYKTQESRKGDLFPYQAGEPLEYADHTLVLQCIEKLLTHAASK